MTRRPLYPEAIERRYVSLLTARTRALRRAALDALARVTGPEVTPAPRGSPDGPLAPRDGGAGGWRTDADPTPAVTDLGGALSILSRLRAVFEDTFSPKIEDLRRLGTQISMFSTRQVNGAVEAAGGAPPPRAPGVPRVGIPAPGSTLDRWARENVSLIKTVDRRFFDDMERLIREAHARGTNVRDLTRQIEDRYSVSKSIARRIARDQTGKLNGKITEERHAELGITEYRWSTSRDERVRGRPDGKFPNARPSHWSREGQTFAWATPPSDGHPGTPIQCRCVAIPIVPGDPRNRKR